MTHNKTQLSSCCKAEAMIMFPNKENEHWVCTNCLGRVFPPSDPEKNVTAKDFIIQKAKTNPLMKGLETNEAQIDLLNEFASLKLREQENKIEELRRSVGRSGEDYLIEIKRKDRAIKLLKSNLQSIEQNQNDKLGKVLEWVLGQEHYLAAAYDKSDKKLPMGEYFIDLFDKEFEKGIER